jgi:hypothetical protein
MTNALSASTSAPVAVGVSSAALLASLGPVATVHTNADVRTTPALMHVSAATVLILGLHRTVPAHHSAKTGRSQS